LGEPQHRLLSAELKWLAAALGGVRDLDVYSERYAAQARRLGKADTESLAPYEKHLESERRTASRNLAGTLRSRRYEELLLLLSRIGDDAAAEAPLSGASSLSGASRVAAELVGAAAR